MLQPAVGPGFNLSDPKPITCSKFGCVTCKIRKIKCDEGRPHCRKCIETRRRCDGYTLVPYSRREFMAAATTSRGSKRKEILNNAAVDVALSKNVVHMLLSCALFASTTEDRCLELFRRGTVAKIGRAHV